MQARTPLNSFRKRSKLMLLRRYLNRRKDVLCVEAGEFLVWDRHKVRNVNLAHSVHIPTRKVRPHSTSLSIPAIKLAHIFHFIQMSPVTCFPGNLHIFPGLLSPNYFYRPPPPFMSSRNVCKWAYQDINILNIMFHAPMGRFQLELIYYFTYFSTFVPSYIWVFLSVGLSLLIHF